MAQYTQTITRLIDFGEGNLGKKFAHLEEQFEGLKLTNLTQLLSNNNLDIGLIQGALDIKKVVGQIHEIVHAVGILLLLPHILVNGETIESLSLGAGNMGKAFDLITDSRLAEFKFTSWKGGPESIRQNQIFKDFFYLAEADIKKKRYLYVLDSKFPVKFFNGGRSITSVCSRNATLAKDFRSKYESKFQKVSEYYKSRKDLVEIVDIYNLMPSLAKTIEELDKTN